MTYLWCGKKISLRESATVLSPFMRPKEAGRDLQNLRNHCQYQKDDEGKYLFEISRTEDFVVGGKFWHDKCKQLEEKESQFAAILAIWHLVDSFFEFTFDQSARSIHGPVSASSLSLDQFHGRISTI